MPLYYQVDPSPPAWPAKAYVSATFTKQLRLSGGREVTYPVFIVKYSKQRVYFIPLSRGRRHNETPCFITICLPIPSFVSITDRSITRVQTPPSLLSLIQIISPSPESASSSNLVFLSLAKSCFLKHGAIALNKPGFSDDSFNRFASNASNAHGSSGDKIKEYNELDGSGNVA